MHLESDVLEVQQDFEHVFFHAFQRGVFVFDVVDADLGDRPSGDGRKQHAAERVAQRMTITAFQRFDDDLGTVTRQHLDLRCLGAQDLVCVYRHVWMVS